MWHKKIISLLLALCAFASVSATGVASSVIPYKPGEVYKRYSIPDERIILCRINIKTGMDEKSLDDGITWQVVGGDFADVHGIWCEEEILTCYRNGIMKGVSFSEFSPNGQLSRAQVIAIAARMYAYWRGKGELIGSQSTPWYACYMDYLKAHDIAYAEELNDALNQPCTRYDFAKILYAVTPVVELQEINNISEVKDVDDPDIIALYKAGVITGYDEELSFDGSNTITRGAAAAIIARFLNNNYRQTLS